MSRDAAAPYLAAGKWKTFDCDRELLAGIRSVDTHGHTPGPCRLPGSKANGQRLLILGDLVHNHAVQFARPEVAFEYDVDARTGRRHPQAHFRPRGQGKADGRRHAPALPRHRPCPQGSPRGYAWVPAEFSPIPTATEVK
jgi:glyoxylase-like metal-dependent hydrolase (beta-lactamase superfamily II)